MADIDVKEIVAEAMMKAIDLEAIFQSSVVSVANDMVREMITSDPAVKQWVRNAVSRELAWWDRAGGSSLRPSELRA
jgi:hypothetical protein